VQNRAPMRTIGDAAQTMVQSIASATKMAKQSLWGPPPLLWQAEEAAEGDEMLVRKLEEQLNAVKQRLSLAGSTTSGGSAEGRIPSTQRRASIGTDRANTPDPTGAPQCADHHLSHISMFIPKCTPILDPDTETDTHRAEVSQNSHRSPRAGGRS
jgi:hypothetical protein